MLIHIIMRLSIAFAVFLAKFVETHSSARPRLEFTNKDTTLISILLPHNLIKEHIQLLEDGKDRVILKTDQQLFSVDFVKNVTTKYGSRCERASRQNEPCAFNITVLHKRNGTSNQVFMCETSKEETICCNRELSVSAECRNSESLKGINNTIKEYRLKVGEPSVFIESPGSDVLYVTQSSTENSFGIYKFGVDRVRPTTPDNAPLSVEPKYLGLAAFHGKNTTQDKLYAFFKEKNTAGGLESDLWLPFVAQVCMADKGGPKTKLQYQWTSQLKARLFCGDKTSRQHFPELVDVAFYHEDGGFSRVYALFRNEWGMRAVCIFSTDAISKVFQTSPFMGNKEKLPLPRPGACPPFKGQHDELLKRLSFVQSHPEMEERVFSVKGPLLVSEHHHYTHIRLHAVPNKGRGHHMLLYLSLESGKIHKVLENETGGFIIAEYSPFRDTTHILDMILHGAEKKLYVSSRKEVVQLELQSCAKYGLRCEDCVLARDPYCGWDGKDCVAADKGKTLQDVEKGDHSICASRTAEKVLDASPKSVPEQSRSVPAQSKYFLCCDMTSRHAKYTWHLPGNATVACRATERCDRCDLLIDSMGSEKEGSYKCTADELGYKRTLVDVQLRVERSLALSLSAAASLGGSSVGWVVALSLLQPAALFVLQNRE